MVNLRLCDFELRARFSLVESLAPVIIEQPSNFENHIFLENVLETENPREF